MSDGRQESVAGPGYAHKFGFNHHYDCLVRGSIDSDVNDLWMYLLRMYFPVDDDCDYSIALQQIPEDVNSEQRADIIVRAVRSGTLQDVIFLRNQAASEEDTQSQWDRSLAQLAGFMAESKKSRGADSSRSIFSIVTIGRYSRYYEMSPDSDILQTYAPVNGEGYEFKDDEGKIDKLLVELRQKTK